MKLTILALALSTYRCGASSRKLPAVAEAEEDYYYDGEVNTYYDGYADADDTAVRAPINGVDDVPAQIGTLLEGVLGPFLGTFQGLETPIVVRYASLIDAVSSQTMIKRKDVEPYKRVMPHSEYPSGSSCLCQGIADYANAFLDATGVTLPPLQHVAPAGSSKVEPGTTPVTDVTLTYATVDALAAACGASRLDGGMHFTGAVEAGADLCAGIGTAGFEYASDLIGGEW